MQSSHVAFEQRVPELLCPFPPLISPHAQQLEHDNLNWLRGFGFASSAVEIARIKTAAFGTLAARAYPIVPLEQLRIAAAWATWLFLRDDQCDETGLGADPVALRKVSDDHLGVLAGREPPKHPDRLANALGDLRERMLRLGGPRWMTRFMMNVEDYFAACVWEAENRSSRTAPNLGAYIRLRDLTGAVRTCFDIYELDESTILPIQLRTDPLLEKLTCLTNRAICWSNDLFSVDKEARSGDCHNLVIVLRQEARLTLNDAILRAAWMHDEAVRSFVRLEQRLSKRRLPLRFTNFVAALKGWMRANLDWSRETGRYAPGRIHEEAGIEPWRA